MKRNCRNYKLIAGEKKEPDSLRGHLFFFALISWNCKQNDGKCILITLSKGLQHLDGKKETGSKKMRWTHLERLQSGYCYLTLTLLGRLTQSRHLQAATSKSCRLGEGKDPKNSRLGKRKNWKSGHHRAGERNGSRRKMPTSQLSMFWSGKA